jgi:hypothetical protein
LPLRSIIFGFFILHLAVLEIFPLMASAAAQEPAPVEHEDFKKLRYEEDYKYLADSRRRTNVWESIKYIPLGSLPGSYLSLGGEIRERYEYTRNPVWGEDPQDKRGVFLQRYNVHADLHLGKYIRIFSQLNSVLANGRAGGPSPVDESKLTLQQAFLDLNGSPRPDVSLTMRTGRQEIILGSGRLVDIREGPNLRRKFDGFRPFMVTSKWRVDGLAVRPAKDQDGFFDDDGSDYAKALWGLYGVRKEVFFPQDGIDLYYLGFQNDAAVYEQGTGKETRHSLGTRIWGQEAGWDYNFEFLYQLGTFGPGRTNAWTAASIAGYTWPQAPLKPRLALSANIASGDQDPADNNLQTFNPLFPRGNYFSELALLGPFNFFNIHPFLTIQPFSSLSTTLDVDFFWRQSLNDGVYSPNGQLLRASDGSTARYVGTEISFTNEWKVNRHLTLTAIYCHFFPGNFIRQTGTAQPIDFIEITARFLF